MPGEGRKIPYWIEIGIQDDKLRRQMSQWNWEEIMGTDRLASLLKKQGKEANSIITKELGNTNIDWDKALQSDAFKNAVTKIVQHTNAEMRKGLLGKDDAKNIQEFVTAIGNAWKELGVKMDSDGFARSVAAFARSIEPLAGQVDKLEAAFDELFKKIDQKRSMQPIVSTTGVTSGGKQIRKFANEISALETLLNRVSKKEVNIGFKDNLKEQFNNLKVEIVSMEDEIQALEDKLKQDNLTASNRNNLSIRLAQERLLLAEHYRKMENVDKEYLKQNKGKDSLFTNAMTKDMQEAINNATKYANNTIKNLKKIKETVKTPDNAINVEMVIPSVDAIKSKVNETIQKLNKPGSLNKIMVEIDTATDLSNKDIVGTKKANQDAQINEKEFQKNISRLQELHKKKKSLEVQQSEVFAPTRKHEIEAIEKEMQVLIAVQQGLKGVKGSFGEHLIASINKALNRVDATVESKASGWRDKIVEAFQIDKGDIKVPFSAESSAEIIFNEIQNYFQENQIELHLNKEAFMQEVKQAIGEGGLPAGNLGGTVALDEKSVALAFAKGLQAFFMGDFTSLAGGEKVQKNEPKQKKAYNYFDPSNPFNRDVANSFGEVIKAGTQKGGGKIKDFFSMKGIDVEQMANASAGELLDLLGQLTDRFGSTVADQFKQLMNDVGKNGAGSKIGNFLGDFEELLYTNRISQTTIDDSIKKDKQMSLWNNYVEKSVLGSGLGQLLGLTKNGLDISKIDKKIPKIDDIEEYIGIAKNYANSSGLTSINEEIESTRNKIAEAEKAGKEKEVASLHRQLANLQARQREAQGQFNFYDPVVKALESIREARNELVDMSDNTQKRDFINAVKNFQSTIRNIMTELRGELNGYSWGLEIDGMKKIENVNSMYKASRLYKGAFGRDNSKVKVAHLYSAPDAPKDWLDPIPDRTALRNIDTTVPEFELKKDTNKRWEAENTAAIEASKRATESEKLVTENKKRLEAIKTQIQKLEDQRAKGEEDLADNQKELESLANKREVAIRAKNHVKTIDAQLETAKREKLAVDQQVEMFKDVDFSARDSQESAINNEINKFKMWQKDPEKYREEISDLFDEEITAARKRAEQAEKAEAQAWQNLPREQKRLDSEILSQEESARSARSSGNEKLAKAYETDVERLRKIRDNLPNEINTIVKATEQAWAEYDALMDKIYTGTESTRSDYIKEAQSKINEAIQKEEIKKARLLPNPKKEAESRQQQLDKEIARWEAERTQIVKSDDYKTANEIDELEAKNERLTSNIEDAKNQLEQLQTAKQNLTPEKTTEELLNAESINVDDIVTEIGNLESRLQAAKEDVSNIESYVDGVIKDKNYKKPSGEIGYTKKNQGIINKYNEAYRRQLYINELISGNEAPQLDGFANFSKKDIESIKNIKQDRESLKYIDQLRGFLRDSSGQNRHPGAIFHNMENVFKEFSLMNEKNQEQAMKENATEEDRFKAQWSKQLFNQMNEFRNVYREFSPIDGAEAEAVFNDFWHSIESNIKNNLTKGIEALKPSLSSSTEVINTLKPEVEMANQQLKDTYITKVQGWFDQIREKQKIVNKGDVDGASEAAKNAAGLAAKEISELFPLITTAMSNYKKTFEEDLKLSEENDTLLKNKINYRSFLDQKTSGIKDELNVNKDYILSSERNTLLQTRRGELLKDIKTAISEKKDTKELEKALKAVNDELAKYSQYKNILSKDAISAVFYEDTEFANQYSAKLQEIISKENELDLAQAKGVPQADINSKYEAINKAHIESEDILRNKLQEKQKALLEDIKINAAEGKSVTDLAKQLDLVNQELVELEVHQDIRKQTAIGGDLYKASTTSVQSYTTAFREAITAKQELNRLEAEGKNTSDAAKSLQRAEKNVRETINSAIRARVDGPSNNNPRVQALDYLSNTENSYQLAWAKRQDAQRRKGRYEAELEALRTDDSYSTSHQYKYHYNSIKRELTSDYVHSDKYKADRATGLQTAFNEMEKYLLEALRPAAENAMKVAEHGIDVDGAIEPKTVQEIRGVFKQILNRINEGSDLNNIKQQLMDVAKNYSANDQEKQSIITAIDEVISNKNKNEINVENALAKITEPLNAVDSTEVRGGVEKLLEQNVQKVMYSLKQSLGKKGMKIDPKQFEESIALGAQGGWSGIETYFEKEFETSEKYKELATQRDTARRVSFESKLAELDTQQKTIEDERKRKLEEIMSATEKEYEPLDKIMKQKTPKFEKIEAGFNKILSDINKNSNMKDVRRQLMEIAKRYGANKYERQEIDKAIEDNLLNRRYDKINPKGVMASVSQDAVREYAKSLLIGQQETAAERQINNIEKSKSRFDEKHKLGQWRADKETEQNIGSQINEELSKYIHTMLNPETNKNLANMFTGDFAKELGISTEVMNVFKALMEQYVYNLAGSYSQGLEVRDGYLSGIDLSKEEQNRFVTNKTGDIDIQKTIEKWLIARRDIAEQDEKQAEQEIADIEGKRKRAIEKGGLSRSDTRDAETQKELAEFKAKVTAEKARQKELTTEINRLEKEGASTEELGVIRKQLDQTNDNIVKYEKFANNRELLIEMNRKAAEDERKLQTYTLDEQKLFYEAKRAKAEERLGSDDERVRKKAEEDIARFDDILGRIVAKIETNAAKEREKNDPMNILANRFAGAIRKSLGGNNGLNVDATGLATEATLSQIYEMLVGIIQAMGGKVIRDPEKDAMLAELRALEAKKTASTRENSGGSNKRKTPTSKYADDFNFTDALNKQADEVRKYNKGTKEYILEQAKLYKLLWDYKASSPELSKLANKDLYNRAEIKALDLDPKLSSAKKRATEYKSLGGTEDIEALAQEFVNKFKIKIAENIDKTNAESVKRVENEKKATGVAYNDAVSVGYDRIQKLQKLRDGGITGPNSTDVLLRAGHAVWDKVKSNNFFSNIPEEGLQRFTKINEVIRTAVSELLQTLGMTEDQVVQQLQDVRNATGGNFKSNGHDSGWNHFATYNENGNKHPVRKDNGITYKVYAAFDDIKDLNAETISSVMKELTAAGFRGRLKTTSGSTALDNKVDAIVNTDQLVIHGSSKKDQEIAYNVLKQMGLNLSYLGGGIDTPDGSFTQTLSSNEIGKYVDIKPKIQPSAIAEEVKENAEQTPPVAEAGFAESQKRIKNEQAATLEAQKQLDSAKTETAESQKQVEIAKTQTAHTMDQHYNNYQRGNANDFLAVHNMRTSELTRALNIGGLIKPSTAVVKAQDGHTGFGEISALLKSSAIDPSTDKGNKLYGADAWTPTLVPLKKDAKFDTKETNSMVKYLNEMVGLTDVLNLNAKQFKDQMRSVDGSIYTAFAHNTGIQTAYAKEKGLIKDIPLDNNGKADMTSLQAILESKLNQDSEWRSYKEWLNAISDRVIKSYRPATAQDYLKHMNQQPAMGKSFRLSANGSLVVPTVEYKTFDQMYQNSGRLDRNANVEINKVAQSFLDLAKKISTQQNKPIQDVVDAINKAFAYRYDNKGIVDTFNKSGIGITEDQTSQIANLYRKTLELPTPYFEAKPGGVVDFDSIAQWILPDNIDQTIKDAFNQKGFKYSEYKAGNHDSWRQAQQNAINAMFSSSKASESVANTSHLEQVKNIISGITAETKGTERSLSAVSSGIEKLGKAKGIQAFKEFKESLLALQSGKMPLEDATQKAQKFVDTFANYKANSFSDLSQWFGKDVQANATSLLGIVKQIFEVTNKEHKARKVTKKAEEVKPAQQIASAAQAEAAATAQVTEERTKQREVESSYTTEDARRERELRQKLGDYKGPQVDFSSSDMALAKEDTLRKIYMLIEQIKTEGIKKGGGSSTKKRTTDGDRAASIQRKVLANKDTILGYGDKSSPSNAIEKYTALVQSIEDNVALISNKGTSKDKKDVAMTQLKKDAREISALEFNILKDAQSWEYKRTQSDKIYSREQLNAKSPDLRTAMESIAKEDATKSGKQYEFLNFDGTKLIYQLTDIRGNIEKATMEWSEFGQEAFVASEKATNKLEVLSGRLGKFDEKFNNAIGMGYLDENGKEFTDYKSQLKTLDVAMAQIAEKDIVDDNDYKQIEQLKNNALRAADVVTKKIAENKKLYTGTTEMNSAKRQFDHLDGSGILDRADLMVEAYKHAYDQIGVIQAKWQAKGGGKGLLKPEAQKELRMAATNAQNLGKELEKAYNTSQRLQQAVNNSGEYNGQPIGDISKVAKDVNIYDQMIAKLKELGAEHIKVDKLHQTATGTIRHNDTVVSDLTVEYDKLTDSLARYQKQERTSLTGLPAFLNGFKKKFNSIMQYVTMSMSIYRVLAYVRQGVQYIKEIDAALTELKKVTDETEETYERFLDTASKTADKVGSTIKDVVSSTADWARLGYTIQEAHKLAESTQILMNVSEFTDVNQATDSLISSIQANINAWLYRNMQLSHI